MTNSAIVIGIKGLILTAKEKAFIKEKKPIGIILFSRNIKNSSQVISLTKSIKQLLGKNTMILIDQEGGRVSRLNKNIWSSTPAAHYFGKIAKSDISKAQKMTFENYNKIGKILKKIGINYNCAPVLDLKNRGCLAPMAPTLKRPLLIERNAGCGRMECSRCKHGFCWFCLKPVKVGVNTVKELFYDIL